MNAFVRAATVEHTVVIVDNMAGTITAAPTPMIRRAPIRVALSAASAAITPASRNSR